jgi:hypothetical protein
VRPCLHPAVGTGVVTNSRHLRCRLLVPSHLRAALPPAVYTPGPRMVDPIPPTALSSLTSQLSVWLPPTNAYPSRPCSSPRLYYPPLSHLFTCSSYGRLAQAAKLFYLTIPRRPYIHWTRHNNKAPLLLATTLTDLTSTPLLVGTIHVLSARSFEHNAHCGTIRRKLSAEARSLHLESSWKVSEEAIIAGWSLSPQGMSSATF